MLFAMSRTNPTFPEPETQDPPPAGTRPVVRYGHEAVVYQIPVAPSTENVTHQKTTISLPAESKWTSGLHFHANHTEYLRLVRGAIFVELNGETRYISERNGGGFDPKTGRLIGEGLIIEVRPYAKHNWGRAAEHYCNLNPHLRRADPTLRLWPDGWMETAVVEEWTMPSDISKPLFFWNLNGTIMRHNDTLLSPRQRIAERLLGQWWIDLQLFNVFWELDNYPIFLDSSHLWQVFSPMQRLGISNGIEVGVSFVVLFVARILGIVLGLKAVEQRRTPKALWEAYRKSPRDL
jgi:hypothetical protein